MKRQNIKAYLTRLHKQSSYTNETGSITLEAAFIMPFLILFIFFFYLLIMITSAQMALQSLASNSVQQLSAYIYPVQLSYAALSSNQSTTTVLSDTTNLKWKELLREGASWIPDPVGELVSEALNGNWQPAVNIAATSVGKHIIEPYIREHVTTSVLDAKRVFLQRIELPDFKKQGPKFLSIALEYEFPFKVPILNQGIMLREQAQQRVWLPDDIAASSNDRPDDGEFIDIHIISIEPTPVAPGHKATVKAITAPHTEASLEVIYKSGRSIAKHLGSKVSNEKGEIEWTWHVSGNTTPGIWTIQVKVTGQSEVTTRHLIVEKREDK